jgi:DNA primase large subunit
MDSDLVRRVARRVFERTDNIRNYVMLEGLIRRFLQLNPDADPETVDWAAVWDDTLTYEELIQAYREQYPMYRWEDKAVDEEAYQHQKEDRIKDVAVEVMNQINIEDFDKLLQELQRLKEEVLEDIKREETQQVARAEIQPPPPVKAETPPTPRIQASLTLFAKYPFLQQAMPIMRAYKLESVPDEVRRRAVERLLEAIDRGERGIRPRLENPWSELLSHPYARAIISYIGDDWLRRRWALAEAARIERLLHSEPDDVVLQVAGELQVTLPGQGWRMHFTKYLHLTKRLRSEISWKLVNKQVSNGVVSLTRSEVIRLVREALYEAFSQTKPRPLNWDPPEAKTIQEALQRRVSKTVAPAPSREWAPCMVALRNRVAEASHFGLFALAAYMTQKNYNTDEIIDVLTPRSDFDPRIARYQVEHIAGLRGSRVKYKPPGCSAMKTHGLCIDNGRQCPYNIKNPLQYRPIGSAGPK